MSKRYKVFSVLGLPIHLMTNYPNWLLERLQQGEGTHVVTLNAEMTMQAERNTSLAKVIQAAELVIPDGAGVVLYLQLLLRQKIQRCPGIELAEKLLQEVERHTEAKVFFYGGAPSLAATAAEFWLSQLPKLRITGTHSGYHSEEEEEKLRQTLSQLQPQVIFVGLGVPRQELWIAQNRHLCPQAIWIGVGGSFDIWSGTKSRAPAWLGDNNLEWLYRLYQEPWRWRRMLALPEFAWKAVVYRLTARGAIS
ncbi:WecB/TagA/CpsF family glycosyltransferase [Plectonema radiosum NIES-515]|uniref:WecB/TagA/CpsF family glycosyltransferase n=1 Tax=Plectonema radiosum NIES-515 TaxID=2986073 RepID=A0ABT3B4G3_9CYAN|nr:WecB/TagA/CpsF family glycosyltransferase [Plectonema radiosum]MCV3216261.1 WecB/TagA/CpsF family glycosyltransferase [Plectonema radiosum NIES-515]